MITLRDRVLTVLADAGENGLREEQLAAVIFHSAQDHGFELSSACESLMANGEIERHGKGTDDIPYTYRLPNGRVPRL
jgi:hypothetical protein